MTTAFPAANSAKKRRRGPKLRPIEESVLHRIAVIFGEYSAAARALKDAEERRFHGQRVEFYETTEKGSNAILVFGLDPE